MLDFEQAVAYTLDDMSSVRIANSIALAGVDLAVELDRRKAFEFEGIPVAIWDEFSEATTGVPRDVAVGVVAIVDMSTIVISSSVASLPHRVLNAILAHEASHIVHNDLEDSIEYELRCDREAAEGGYDVGAALQYVDDIIRRRIPELHRYDFYRIAMDMRIAHLGKV